MRKGVRPLYDYTVSGLKTELLNKGIMSLTGIDTLLIINLIIILSLKLVDMSPKM